MKHLTDQTMLGSIAMKNRFVRAAVGDFTNGGHLTESSFNCTGIWPRVVQPC